MSQEKRVKSQEILEARGAGRGTGPKKASQAVVGIAVVGSGRDRKLLVACKAARSQGAWRWRAWMGRRSQSAEALTVGEDVFSSWLSMWSGWQVVKSLA